MSSHGPSSPPVDGAQPGPTRSMRKSCHFCRSRKIRCSGQSICSACQERNLDCVYGREGAKGRPKLSASKASSTRGIPSKSSKGKSPVARFSETMAPMSRESTPTLAPQSWDYLFVGQTDQPLTVADELDYLFRRLFHTPADACVSKPANAIDAFSRKTSESRSSVSQYQLPREPVTYEQPMKVMIEDMVEMIAVRFGNLSCCPHGDVGSSKIFKDSLECDETLTIFDGLDDLAANPLSQFSNYQTLQTIDVWFSHHPLAFLLSKTLLIQNYRNGTYNEVLLAVVLGDVLTAQPSEETRARGGTLLTWAKSILHKLSSTDFDLSLVQALILLGWSEMCATRARRAVGYFLYTTSLIPNLRKPDICQNRINGLDIGEVESELARNARWLTFSIVLWMFMQCDAPMLDLLNFTQAFPPINESSSSVYALDVASDNTSTLPHQAKTIRELWPICHVASTTAHIYALYPQHKPANIALTPLETPSWQSQTLRRLQNLGDNPRVAPQDFSLLCHKVRHILVGAVDFLETRHEDLASRNLVLSAYHALIVHFLFPSSDLVTGGRDVLITDGLIADFCSSINALLRVNPVLSHPGEGGRMKLYTSSQSIKAEVFMMGLDACSRVFSHLQTSTRLSHEAASISDQQHLLSLASGLRAMLRRGDELANHAVALQSLSKCELLRNTKRSKAVKRQLKQVVQGFEGSGDETPRSVSRRSSHTQSPSAGHSRDNAPSLIHSSSNDSSTSAGSVHQVGPKKPTDDRGACEVVDPSMFSPLVSSAAFESYPVSAGEDVMTGYFEPFAFAPDEKMAENAFHLFNDFTFPLE